jgi:hypothetical protein
VPEKQKTIWRRFVAERSNIGLQPRVNRDPARLIRKRWADDGRAKVAA